MSTFPPNDEPEAAIQAIDELFDYAGLKRNMRGKSGGITTRLRLERAEVEELALPAPEQRSAANGVRWLPVTGWEKKQWLRAGFSTRQGGASTIYAGDDAAPELNLGFTAEDQRETVAGNRRLFLEAVTGNAETPLVTAHQFHSNLIARVGAEDAHRQTPRKADGLITAEAGVMLGIQTADCIPVLVADKKKKVVAAFHAGWRGTVKRIVEIGIGRMRLEFGSKPENLMAAIGPGVGACCYAVGEEVHAEFESQFSYARELFREVYDSDPIRKKYPMLFLTQRAPGHSPIGPSLHLNLVEANRRQLLDAGLKAKAICVLGGCTSCQPEFFFSHRASQGHAGRMMAVIGVHQKNEK